MLLKDTEYFKLLDLENDHNQNFKIDKLKSKSQKKLAWKCIECGN